MKTYTNLERNELIRKALVGLPQDTNPDRPPGVQEVYFPPSHERALDPNHMVITAIRGAGKTFWWRALQSKESASIHWHGFPKVGVERGYGGLYRLRR